MKRPPRIFTEGDKRYILINGKRYYLKTKSNDKKLVSIVINNIMNKVKRRKRKGILQKKPSKLESSSSSSSSSTTPSTSNIYNTLTYANSYHKYQQLLSDMKVEEARNELNKQKQVNNAFQPTNPQYAITSGTPNQFLSQITNLETVLRNQEKQLEQQNKFMKSLKITPTYEDEDGNQISEKEYKNQVKARKELIESMKEDLHDTKKEMESLSKKNAELEKEEQKASKIKSQLPFQTPNTKKETIKKLTENFDKNNLDRTLKVPVWKSNSSVSQKEIEIDKNGNINVVGSNTIKFNSPTWKQRQKEYGTELWPSEIPKELPTFEETIKKETQKIKNSPYKAVSKLFKKSGKEEVNPNDEEEDPSGQGHEEAEGDGLYDYELDDIMKGYKKYGYLGCFTLDEIKKINPENKKRISFFLNHDEHWMAVYLDASKDLSLEFMDPFASPPPSGFKEAMHLLINKMAPKLYLKYKINQIPQQNVRSDNCGAIAARFLMDRYAGKSFKEATNYTIEKSEKKAETLRAKFGYGIKPFTFI